jgi:very-short-patch-repair endonuclease
MNDDKPAGENSPMPPNAQPEATTAPPKHSYTPIRSFVENLPPSSKRSVKAASSRKAIGSAPSSLEAQYRLILRAYHVPPPEIEYRFDPVRKWRFDFCWPIQRVAVEIDGGIWKRGGHSSGTGITRDIDKSNAAQLHGWLMLRFTDRHLKNGQALALTCEALGIELEKR